MFFIIVVLPLIATFVIGIPLLVIKHFHEKKDMELKLLREFKATQVPGYRVPNWMG